jgi:hypothetical protein
MHLIAPSPVVDVHSLVARAMFLMEWAALKLKCLRAANELRPRGKILPRITLLRF